MLLQLIINQPQALGTIVRNTPLWVGGLLAALLALGLSQLRERSASLVRVSIMPVAMVALSVLQMVSNFGKSPQLTLMFGAWLVMACVVLAGVSGGSSGARYNSASRRFVVPGSWVPLALILGIFLTKFVAGVEMAMQPQLVSDDLFTLTVSALFGVFNGVFAGRAAKLWRLALQSTKITPRSTLNA